jgi:NAD(P)-dependent dehydrogenase (short-subunit alcohol dehydrogenase family)
MSDLDKNRGPVPEDAERAQDLVLDAKPILERFSLKGRTALVTGGGQGIGRALAHALGQAGAAVAVADIVSSKAAAVADELTQRGITAMYLEADVSNSASVDHMIEVVRLTWGSLTIAVNNAGISSWADSEKLSDEEWRRIMNVNLDGVFWCCRAEGALMLGSGYGKIINIASMSGHVVNIPQNQAAYNTSKAGVLHLTRSLAAEWASRGIRVNTISPGYTFTQLMGDLVATPAGKMNMDRWLELIPMGKMCKLTDLQGVVVYLASEASDMITGADLVIDGGYCCW